MYLGMRLSGSWGEERGEGTGRPKGGMVVLEVVVLLHGLILVV